MFATGAVIFSVILTKFVPRCRLASWGNGEYLVTTYYKWTVYKWGYFWWHWFHWNSVLFFFNPHLKAWFSISGARERERETETERDTDVVSHTCPWPGTEPTTRTCALTWNWTHDLWVYKTTLQPTDPHWPGLKLCTPLGEKNEVFHLIEITK